MNLIEPAPINHNELKRLLQECFLEVINTCYPSPFSGMFPTRTRNDLVNSINRRIDNAILDGDDS